MDVPGKGFEGIKPLEYFSLGVLGLVSALHELTLQYGEQVAMCFKAPDHLPELPAAAEVAIYRIAQEALTNVVRHANAHHCDMHLDLDEINGLLTLSIQRTPPGEKCGCRSHLDAGTG
jgi:signal transduction histidine kinase